MKTATITIVGTSGKKEQVKIKVSSKEVAEQYAKDRAWTVEKISIR